MTRALVQGLLPPQAEEDWLAIALVWVDWNPDDAEQVYAHIRAAAHTAVQPALMPNGPTRSELAEGWTHIGNPFFTRKPL